MEQLFVDAGTRLPGGRFYGYVKIGFTALESFRRQSPDFVFQGPVGRRQFDGEVQLLGVQRAYLDRYFFIGDLPKPVMDFIMSVSSKVKFVQI